MPSKVALIGLDCATPELVFDRFLPDLPNLRRLVASGVHGPLESTIPPITVPAWMCMMTGRDPGTLGIYGFRNRRDHSYDGLAIASSRMVREEAVWDVLARRGLRSIMVGIPLTYPPRPVNGLMVSGFPMPGPDAEYTYPPGLRAEIRERFGEYIADVRQFRTDDKARLLDDIHAMTRQRFALARHLVTTHPWDFVAMVEMGPDRMHHGFWRYWDRDHPLHEPGNLLESALHDYYVALDAEIGRTLEVLPPDTLVLVVSDHGAKRMDGGVCLNEWLLREGYLALREPVSGLTPFSPDLVDWDRTRAWGDGGYYGRVFLNVAGREPRGVVPAEGYEALRDELTRRLEALPGPDGQAIGTRVFRPEHVYRAVTNVAPDLIAYFGDLHWRSVGSLGHASVWTPDNDTGPDDANHAQQGIAVLWEGGGAAGGTRREGMSIYDVAPTILRAFGIEPPPGMGREALAGEAGPAGYTDDEEAEIARRLEDLGYL